MYLNILVAVDGSPASAHALQEAISLAGEKGFIRIVTVVENPFWTIPLEYGEAYDVELIRKSMLQTGKDILERARQILSGKGVKFGVHLVDLSETGIRNIPMALLNEAEEWPADVIVVGTHGRRGSNRLLMGSVAERLARLSSKPVLLVHGPVKRKQDEERAEDGRDVLFSDWPEDELMGS